MDGSIEHWGPTERVSQAQRMEGKWGRMWELMQQANQHYSLGHEKSRMLWQAAQGVPQGGLIVELGVCHGSTALMLATIAQEKQGQYVGVDDWSLEGSLAEVCKLMVEVELDHCVNFLWGKTQEVPLPNRPIDLLLIDAGHDPDNVSADCRRWIPEVASGGLVAFDDCPGLPGTWFENQPTQDADPHWGVRLYADKHTCNWENVGFWAGLLIRRKP